MCFSWLYSRSVIVTHNMPRFQYYWIMSNCFPKSLNHFTVPPWELSLFCIVSIHVILRLFNFGHLEGRCIVVPRCCFNVFDNRLSWGLLFKSPSFLSTSYLCFSFWVVQVLCIFWIWVFFISFINTTTYSEP